MIPASVHLGTRAGGKAAVVARRAAAGLQQRANTAASPAHAPAAASAVSIQQSFDDVNSKGGHVVIGMLHGQQRQYHVLTTTTTSTTAATSHSAVSASASMTARKLVRVGNTNHFRWFSEKATSSEETDEKMAAGEEAAAGTAEEAPADTPAEDDPAQKIEALEGELKNLKDQLLRSLAEQENIRNIARRDVDAAKQFSIRSFAKSLLEVADNLERALEAATAGSGDTDETTVTHSVESFLEGVQLTSTGLVKALQSNGVTAFCEQPGDVFDPTTMNALMEYPDPNSEPGTVGQVIKKGYKLNGRVLRPAEVAVIKKV